MNLNDLYEMRDPRDAYERDVANSTSGFGKDSQAYRADGGANDENHALDQQSSTWYIRLNGKLIRDKSDNPYAFQDKAAANKAARTMQAKLFNKDKEFMLTTNPNDKPQGVAETGSNDVEEFLHKVARSGDNGFDMLYNAQQGKYGREIEQSIQDMYDDISIDTGYHGDDDFEQIYDRMLDNIEADYGQQGMAEAKVDSDGHSVDHADSGEYDYEGDQAKDQLNTIVRAARRLNGMLDDNENMPEWVQMKITNAADYIDTAADYIESNQEPELAEGERGRGRPPSGQQDTTPVTPGRVEKTATGIRHHADASRYGGTEPDAEDDHLMSKSHISRLGKMTEPDIDEGEKVGNMDADKFDAAMSRLKQLAGAGPMKTVYDPTKRVYRNVPTAVQPKK
jgi:hypothetical protein